MFNSTRIRNWCIKALSIFIKLSDNDKDKVEIVKKIVNTNFDLSPRGIRKMLNLNNPIYEITQLTGTLAGNPQIKVSFLEKTDKVDLFRL